MQTYITEEVIQIPKNIGILTPKCYIYFDDNDEFELQFCNRFDFDQFPWSKMSVHYTMYSYL